MFHRDISRRRIPGKTASRIVGGALSLLLAAATTSLPAVAQSGGEPIATAKLGAVYAFTGPFAIYSTTIKNGLEMAAEELNAQDGIKLDLLMEDDRSTKDDAINVYQKFIQRDNVLLILGPLTGGQVFAAAPLAQRAKVPVMLTSVATTGVTNVGDYIFRTSVESAAIIPATVKVAKEQLKVATAALIYTNDDQNALGDKKAYEAALKESGITLIATETVRTGDVDFSAQLTKIRSLNPDALIINSQGEEAVGIMTQARKLGLKAHFLGANSFNAAGVVRDAGKAMEGALSATPWFVGMTDAKNVAFVRKYREKYKSDPDWLAAQSYDALYLVRQALTNAKITRNDSIAVARTKLRDSLAAIKSFDGLLGRIEFQANRDPIVQGAVIEVRDGKHTLAAKQ